MPIYNGTAAEYEEWLFRVRGKHRRAQNDEERRDVVNKIVLVPTSRDKPKTPVVMESITISE